ncbi:hypothetical protein IMZ48_18625 [Candidatus Bathyarchaeota archaeon]|nr:hypothetical protein [Candidatus Bathyarchaeota archaeon]
MLTEEHRIYPQGLGKVLHLLRRVDAILDHELPEPNVDTSDHGSVESRLKAEV